MQSSLKKSLYLGLAALSFASVAAVSTTASAKSYATAGAYTTLTADATKRNVQATGTNALYTKPGTVKGAKVVASKATMATLASSKKSANYFRAYGVKTTNRGSVYYRVVTMDGKYRGYVYGGKSADAFAGGVKAAETTTKATTPVRTTGYYLKDTSKNTLWTAPRFTQYKASKVNLYGATKNDPFTVDSAVTKTQEGSLYYHVTDSKDSSISGWVFAGKGYDTTITDPAKQDLGGLSLNVASDAATNDNSVKVVYRDASNKQVATSTWVNSPKTGDAATKAGDTVNTAAVNAAGVTFANFVTNSLPSGYKVTTATTPNAAQYGNTVYVDVTAAASSKISFVVDKVNTDAGTVANGVKLGSTVAKSEISATLAETGIKALTGDKGTQIGETNLATIDSALSITKAEGTTNYYDAKGAAYHYTYALTTTTSSTGTPSSTFATDNRLANYGDTLKASVTATLVAGPASTNTSDSSWIA
ncbi:S-layer protein [Levilactobacillus enshiensis]|uniref:S-layer protein n=1 Tax=Levilactobacillus enshiensis TaxID=2590213 RepID=UPI00298CDFBC|nr:S-layer protein [Levilactobacillus enshiensis]